MLERLFRWLGLATQSQIDELREEIPRFNPEAFDGYESRSRYLSRRLEILEERLEEARDKCEYV